MPSTFIKRAAFGLLCLLTISTAAEADDIFDFYSLPYNSYFGQSDYVSESPVDSFGAVSPNAYFTGQYNFHANRDSRFLWHLPLT